MKLTYTVELDFGEDADITPEWQSKWLMERAFAKVGQGIGGQTLHHLSIWPHEDSRLPDDADPGADEILDGLPPHTNCECCGITMFTTDPTEAQ